ncbi:MAG: hypothetical protein NTV16_05180 [Actinobacteria bacterium]|nr:hypothetical protein [Actinomycetota bacterium]
MSAGRWNLKGSWVGKGKVRCCLVRALVQFKHKIIVIESNNTHSNYVQKEILRLIKNIYLLFI